MFSNGAPPSSAIVNALATGTKPGRVRLSVSACGIFFAGTALWLGIALLLLPEPSSLLWIIPVSIVLGVALTIVFTHWGAASLMQFVADRNGVIRVVMGRAGVVRMSKRIGQRSYFRRDFMLGGLTVLACIAIAILLAALGAGQNIVLGVFVLPLVWLFLASGIFMMRTAFRIRSTDIPLEGVSVSPLAAVYLRSGGAAEDLSRGVAADRLVGGLTGADLAEAASVARVLSRIRHVY